MAWPLATRWPSTRTHESTNATRYYDFYNDNNNWSMNVDKRPHRHVVTPRGGEWILVYGSVGSSDTASTTLSHRYSSQLTTQTDRQTDTQTTLHATSVTIGSIYALRAGNAA